MALSLESGYAVILLSLAAVVFYLLSRTILLSNPQKIAAPAVTAPNIDGILSAYDLSEREMEIALLMAREGLSYKEMGERLYISPLTIKVHVSHIFQKLDVKKRAEFMAKVLKR
jgi:DNA-binding NarL/FixJ family response regulator